MGYNYLNEGNVRAIQRKLLDGISQTEIAHMYEITISSIGHIADGRTWRDIAIPGWRRWQKKRFEMKLHRPKRRIKLHRRKKVVRIKRGNAQ